MTKRPKAKAEGGVSTIARREQALTPATPDPLSVQGGLLHEFLLGVLEDGQHYSLESRGTQPSADGGQEEAVRELNFFHLLRTAHGQTRPKSLATAEDADDLVDWQLSRPLPGTATDAKTSLG